MRIRINRAILNKFCFMSESNDPSHEEHIFFFFKQKTAYEMSLRDWSSDVCSSDLGGARDAGGTGSATTGDTTGEATGDTTGASTSAAWSACASARSWSARADSRLTVGSS